MFKKFGKYYNTFVIGDVHGCYYTLLKLVEKLPSKAKLIFVGDLCDKGNFSKEVIEYVISNKHKCILGNHEYLFLNNYDKTDSKWANETYMGGYKTLDSYKNDKELFQRHLKWIESLPSYIIKGEYFITHGYGLPYYQRRDEERSKKSLMSNRKDFYGKWAEDWEKDHWNYGVFNIFGHDYGSKPICDKQYYNIDSGCVYGEKLTAFSLETKEVITQETDLRDIVTSKDGFEFIPNIESPYGFTLKAPKGFPSAWVSMHSDTKYLSINFTKETSKGQVYKNYLFDKDKNHITWKQRHNQIKDKVETKDFENGFKVERLRTINFEKEYEQTYDVLYKDEEVIDKSNSLVTNGKYGKIDWIYESYLNMLEEKKEKEDERIEKLKNVLSMNLKEQKDFIENEVIYITMMHIFHGPIRELGPLKELPFKYFRDEYKELDNKLFNQLYIHALTVFALTMNESECYKNVNVKKYVYSQAIKYNLKDAFAKYFDETTKIDTKKILG